ncbi:PREDICTED: probable acyl-activating enzyme 2 isoform X2 [Tarenaya hassleriana]|nr:PREDICTED: probable acyl-activating enzyme 2 isoform X2 [Tarenaya hassleriana]
MYELHFAVPMAGGVLCPLNTRLDPSMLSVFLRHSEAVILFADHQFLELAQRTFDLLSMSEKSRNLPTLVRISQPDDDANVSPPSDCEYESLLLSGSDKFAGRKPESEWDPISINYTSGTTLRPRGVVCSHRGAYVNSLATAFLPKMGPSSSPVYLWTIPMFHGNGWSLTWGMAAQGGTNVCLRKVSAKGIFKNIATQNVTHIGGAPTVLNMILNSTLEERQKLSRKVEVFTGGAPPPLQILTEMEELGFNVTNVYGMTETTGPGTYCESKPEWALLPARERSKLKARQGLKHLAVDDVEVKDPVTMETVPADGSTEGEVMFRGNNVMMGYLKDMESTREAFRGGWLHSGDLAVKHPDGYIEITGRLKDLIISGGENINPVEVERALCCHEAVLEAAVVARPDGHWGETPCAFVKLKDGFDAESGEMIEFCRNRLPHFMAPRTVVFGDLPKSSTGKIQKRLLRQRALELGSLL